jgi:peptide/nickel transport system permease protein
MPPPAAAGGTRNEGGLKTMSAYLFRRLWQSVPTLLGAILFVFLLFNWVGGDPAYVLAGKFSSPEQVEAIRRQLGVDQPLYVQLWIFIRQMLTGDFGLSWATNEPVANILATRLGPSLTVLLPMLLISTLIALAAALLAARLRGSVTDRMIMVSCTAGQSISILVYIIVLQYVLGYRLEWFPVQGWGNSLAQNLFVYSLLPVLVGVLVSLAPDIRLYRSFFLEEIRQDYVRTARAKGLSEARIMAVHVLRNAGIPVITHVLIQLPALLTGAFLIERFFSIPGIGREVILAVERSDFPVIKAVTVYIAMATIAVNIITDLVYRALDPRVRLE